MLNKYEVDLKKETNGDIGEIVAIGMMYIIVEDKSLWKPILEIDETKIQEIPKIEDNFNSFEGVEPLNKINISSAGVDVGCMFGVIAGIAGVTDIKGIIRNLELGAMPAATAWAAMRVIFKRVLTVFLVFEAVYGMGSCFGWW